MRAARARPSAPAQIMTKAGVRERDRGGDGARRLDERGVAPARDRQRGARRARSSTTSTAVGARVPHLADMKPHGKYHMADLDAHRRRAGRDAGAPRRRAPPRRLPHGHRARRSPRTWPPSIRPRPTARSSTRSPAPIHAHGGIAVLRGSLAPNGAVVKVAGIDQPRFEGTARVFDGEDGAMEAILAGKIEPGDVVVIRYEGPKGGPGMREMLAVTGALKGAGRGGDCRARHRRPLLGRDAGLLRRPRRARGRRRWPDRARRRRRPHRHRRRTPAIDLARRRRGARRRRAEWKLPEPRYTSGVLAKYAKLAQGADMAPSRTCDHLWSHKQSTCRLFVGRGRPPPSRRTTFASISSRRPVALRRRRRATAATNTCANTMRRRPSRTGRRHTLDRERVAASGESRLSVRTAITSRAPLISRRTTASRIQRS